MTYIINLLCKKQIDSCSPIIFTNDIEWERLRHATRVLTVSQVQFMLLSFNVK